MNNQLERKIHELKQRMDKKESELMYTNDTAKHREIQKSLDSDLQEFRLATQELKVLENEMAFQARQRVYSLHGRTLTKKSEADTMIDSDAWKFNSRNTIQDFTIAPEWRTLRPVETDLHSNSPRPVLFPTQPIASHSYQEYGQDKRLEEYLSVVGTMSSTGRGRQYKDYGGYAMPHSAPVPIQHLPIIEEQSFPTMSMPASRPSSQYTLAPKVPEKPKKSVKKIHVILGVLMLLLLIGIGIALYFILAPKPATSTLSNDTSSPIPTALSVLAGSGVPETSSDGQGRQANIYNPSGITIGNDGAIFVTEPPFALIRKITKQGLVTTFAGSRAEHGVRDGNSTFAMFYGPFGITKDKLGNLFTADARGHAIRRISATGQVTTVAGGVRRGYNDGPAQTALFAFPYDLAVNSKGDLIVADTFNNAIRRITPDGIVSTIAGLPSNITGFLNGKGPDARFNRPVGLAIDDKDNVLVADSGNHAIRMVTPEGDVSTLVGSGQPGFQDGSNIDARFNSTSGVAIDRQGIIYVSDHGNNRIRRIAKDGRVSTVAGNGATQGRTGIALDSAINGPEGIAVDDDGTLYVVEAMSNVILSIKP